MQRVEQWFKSDYCIKLMSSKNNIMRILSIKYIRQKKNSNTFLSSSVPRTRTTTSTLQHRNMKINYSKINEKLTTNRISLQQ